MKTKTMLICLLIAYPSLLLAQNEIDPPPAPIDDYVIYMALIAPLIGYYFIQKLKLRYNDNKIT